MGAGIAVGRWGQSLAPVNSPVRFAAGLRRQVARLADQVRRGVYRHRDSGLRQRVRHLVHVGAHTGEGYAGRLAALSPIQVHLFEANPELAADLERRLGGQANVRVYPAALADRDGEDDFHLSAQANGSSLFGTKQNLVAPRRIRVPLLATGAFLDSLEGDIALYLNCEGGEFRIVPQVLEQERWRRLAFCHVDWHDQAWRLPEMAATAKRLRREMIQTGVLQVGADYFFQILTG